MSSWFQAGASKRFRHEQQDGTVFGCDGNGVYGYRTDQDAYFQIAASRAEGGGYVLPDPIPEMLDICDPSLKLALASDAAVELRSGASSIELLADTSLDGVAYKTLRLIPEIGQGITTLLVDPRTYLLRQVKNEFPADPEEPGGQGRTITVDYTDVQVNGPIDPSRFAWTPPVGAVNVVPPQATLGLPAPDFLLNDLKGKQVQLSSLRGNVVLLDFWASWCGPCVYAMPRIEEIVHDIDSPRLKVLAINRQEDEDHVRSVVRRYAIKAQVLLDPTEDACKKYKVRGIPQLVLIGKDGVVKFVTVGLQPQTERKLRQAIREALEKP